MSFLQHTLEHQFGATPYTRRLSNGVTLELLQTGVLRVRPAVQASDYRVLISSGVHGNETAPMEIVEQLFTAIESEELAVNCELMLIIGNPPAANKAQRFIDENLNRLFSGQHKNAPDCYETQRAYELEQYTEAFFNDGDEPRLHYDLHTAIRGSEFEKFAVYPFLGKRAWSISQLGFLEACGIEAVLLSNKPSTTYSYFSSEHFGAHSFTVELGSVKPFGTNNMNNFNAIRQGLKRVIEGKELFEQAPDHLKSFAVVEEVIKLTEAFELHVPDDANNFTAYPKGSLLASDEGYAYRTKLDEERFVFPIKNVPPGNRAMLVVAPTKLSND